MPQSITHIRNNQKGFKSLHQNNFLQTCAKYLDKLNYANETSFD